MKEMTRRDFTKLGAATAAASAAGFMLSGSAFAQESKQPGEPQPGGPYPANFRDVHKRIIAVDGACPLLCDYEGPGTYPMVAAGRL